MEKKNRKNNQKNEKSQKKKSLIYQQSSLGFFHLNQTPCQARANMCPPLTCGCHVYPLHMGSSSWVIGTVDSGVFLLRHMGYDALVE